MAEPIFKTIDYSNQIANNNKAASDSMVKGIQNISNTFLAGRQQSINQARQLMSDFDAVINEVDDMHKENVSGQIAKTQQQLANNIYKKKGKNGVRLQLGDMNSEDFNYARDMRKLKNLATNSRMSRENLDSARDYAKTHQYFENSQQRTAYLAEIATFYSDPKTLNASPKQVQEADRDLRLQYTDVASEAKDIILSDMNKNQTSSYANDASGDEFKTTVTSYGDLFKDGDIDETKIDEHTQLYINRTGIDQTNFEAIKAKLLSSATSTQRQRSRTEEQMQIKDLQLKSIKDEEKRLNDDPFGPDNITKTAQFMATASDEKVVPLLNKIKNDNNDLNVAQQMSTSSDHYEFMRQKDRATEIISLADNQPLTYSDPPETVVSFSMPVKGLETPYEEGYPVDPVKKKVSDLTKDELEYFLRLEYKDFKVSGKMGGFEKPANKESLSRTYSELGEYLSSETRSRLHYQKVWEMNNPSGNPIFYFQTKDDNETPAYVPANSPDEIQSYLRNFSATGRGAINNAQSNYQTDPNDPLSIN